MLTTMHTYGSSFTLRSGAVEEEVLAAAKAHLASDGLELHTGGSSVDPSRVAAASTLDQLFAAFSQVLRRAGDDEIVGSSGVDLEWVDPKPLFDAVRSGFTSGSWYAYRNDFFDYVLVFGDAAVTEHMYDVGVVDPDEAPYREYPHGIGAPDPGRGDRHDQLTRVLRHWLFTKNLAPCRVTSLTKEEALSFIADAQA